MEGPFSLNAKIKVLKAQLNAQKKNNCKYNIKDTDILDGTPCEKVFDKDYFYVL